MLYPVSLIAAAAASAGCILFAVFFMKACRRENHRLALLLKGLAAVCFVLLGLFLRPHSANQSYAQLLILGLILGFCGDELLALRFLVPKIHDLIFAVGAVTFAVGHVFYMKALFDLGVIAPLTLILVLIPGLLLAWLYGKKQGSHAGPLHLAALLYIGLVIFMGAVSVTAAIHAPQPATVLFALGGICFACSDNILVAYCFGKQSNWSQNIWVHITYYAAQLVIAWSILLIR